MKQPVDVLAAFDIGSEIPRPVRFKLFENGIKKAVDVNAVLKTEHLGAGNMVRIEYTCRSAGRNGPIEYKLLYYYVKGSWEIVP